MQLNCIYIMKKAIITGITGQIGSYLAELLLLDDYEVYGIIRPSSTINTTRINHIYSNRHLHLVYGDITDYTTITSIVADTKPDMFFHLAAQSHVRVSFDTPILTGDITGIGTTKCLEACKRFSPKTKFYTALTSEIFGSTPPPQSELTPFHPRSPYGAAKMYSYWITMNYRESYNMFCSNGIVFNTESPRRKETFVTRKITKALTRIKCGLQKELVLGNLDAKRDWGHAIDTAHAMKLILEHDKPDDFVIATGYSHSVREFLDEVGKILKLDWKKYVRIDEKYFRPAEVDYLLGDASKARNLLGWEPTYSFGELVKEMIDYDMNLANKEFLLDR